jgi:hypothetical protein
MAEHQELIDRYTLRILHEACLVLEDGVGTLRELDLGMQAGTGSSSSSAAWPTATSPSSRR